MDELDSMIEYYRSQGAPADQSALISLFDEVQEKEGVIPAEVVKRTAEACGVKESFLLAVIKRIPRLHLGQAKPCLQICCGPNCGRTAALRTFVEKTYGKNPDEFSVSYGSCMRMCGKGPNIKWNGKLYHHADSELIRSLVEKK